MNTTRIPKKLQWAYIHFRDDSPVSRILKAVMLSLTNAYQRPKASVYVRHRGSGLTAFLFARLQKTHHDLTTAPQWLRTEKTYQCYKEGDLGEISDLIVASCQYEEPINHCVVNKPICSCTTRGT